MSSCDSKELALKCFFLGPQSENASIFQVLVSDILNDWFHWRKSLFSKDGKSITTNDQSDIEFLKKQTRLKESLSEALELFSKEVPYHSPRYMAHMFSETSIPALLGHLVTIIHNPNNITGETSKAGAIIETQAISALCEMIGYEPKVSTGHFTSGGTVANFEALLRARNRYFNNLAIAAIATELGVEQFSLQEVTSINYEKYEKILMKLKDKQYNFNSYHLLFGNYFQVITKLQSIYNTNLNQPVVIAPGHRHYSWKKGINLLGLSNESLWEIELDQNGHAKIDHLEFLLNQSINDNRQVIMVVAVAGTTEMGAIDPISKIQKTISQFENKNNQNIWFHVDAAYGGYFKTVNYIDCHNRGSEIQNDLNSIKFANSVTVDAHKLGYVPYSSGSLLVRDLKDYTIGRMDAPYLRFSNSNDRGGFTLEGSRSAAGAVATWLSAKSIGMNEEGYGLILSRTIQMAQKLAKNLYLASSSIHVLESTDSNIVCFSIAENKDTLSIANIKTLKVIERFSIYHPDPDYFVSRTTVKDTVYKDLIHHHVNKWNGTVDTNEMVLVRMTIMNPFVETKSSNTDYIEDFTEKLRLFLMQ